MVGRRRRGGQNEGYTLAVMVMLITVMNIMVAVALPLWSTAIQREKEEELIFRGLQYAEAIRVFQKRFGRYPSRLEELIEVEPRSIRQLWKDPLSEGGEWGLLVQAPRRRPGRPPRGRPDRPGEQPPNPDQPRPGAQNPNRPRGAGGLVPIPPGKEEGERRMVGGQIQGVYSASDETAIKRFLDRDTYDQWHFTVQLIRLPAPGGGDAPLPRATSAWIGRPFRGQLSPQLGGRPQPGAPGATPRPGRPGGANPGRPPRASQQ